MAHEKRYFVAVKLLDEEGKPIDDAYDLLKRPGAPYDRTFMTEKVEVAEAWAAKIRDEYPEQEAIVLEQANP
jgi:hypothetical protein